MRRVQQNGCLLHNPVYVIANSCPANLARKAPAERLFDTLCFIIDRFLFRRVTFADNQKPCFGMPVRDFPGCLQPHVQTLAQTDLPNEQDDWARRWKLKFIAN